MPKLSITGRDLMDALAEHLVHLDACRDFVEDFRKRDLFPYAIDAAQKKGNDWGSKRLATALTAYDKRLGEEAATPKSPGIVARLLSDIETLGLTEEVVQAISSALGHYDPNLPYGVRERLDYLTGFDDSE